MARWLESEQGLVNQVERLWSNVIPITELPRFLNHYYVPNKDDLGQLENSWAFYKQDAHNAWAFGPPDANLTKLSGFRGGVEWGATPYVNGIKSSGIVSHLLTRAIVVHCLRKGLELSPEGTEIFFPHGLVRNDRLQFTQYDGKRTNVKVVGEITFRTSSGAKEKSRYHLAPVFVTLMGRFGNPSYQINLRIHWTDLNGVAYPKGRSIRRRKRLTRNWWNYEWLSHVNAVIQWITGGKHSVEIMPGLVVSSDPIQLKAPIGIDEGSLTPPKEEEEELELEDDETIGEDEEGAGGSEG